MPRHPHILNNLSELPSARLNGPQGSLFGNKRKRVGMKIGAYANTAGAAQAGFRALYVRDNNVNYYDGEEVERFLTRRSKPWQRYGRPWQTKPAPTAQDGHRPEGFTYFLCRLLRTRPSVSLRFFAASPWRC